MGITLRNNEIFQTLSNQIISLTTFADNIKGTYSQLVDKARVDGGQYGDTKVYVATSALHTSPWGVNENGETGYMDNETNILELFRPKDPEVQKIILDQFRQIRLTTDAYMTKRGFGTPGAFQQFNDTMKGWIRDTKRIFDSTTYNVYIGTTETEIGEQEQTIRPVDGQNDALTMAVALANILTDLKDVSRNFNDLRNIRSYDESDLMIVWNAAHYNQLTSADLPTVYHKAGLLGEFKQTILPAHYFGKIVGTSGKSTSPADNTDPNRTEAPVCAMFESVYEVASKEADYRAEKGKDGKWYVYLFAGERLPNGVEFDKNKAYYEDDSIAFKIIHKDSVPYFSQFEVATSYFNPRSLTETNYLTFSHNTLQYIKNYPLITARFVEAKG